MRILHPEFLQTLICVKGVFLMLAWIVQNLATIVVCAVLLLVTVLIVVKLVRDRKQGKGSCGANCAGCAHCANSGCCRHP